LSLTAVILPAQTSRGGLTFEAVSIRPSDPRSQGLHFATTADNGFRATGVTVRFLVHLAYDLEDFQISGGPGWLRSDRFDIYAKPEAPDATDLDLTPNGAVEQLRAERLRERIRALLAGRFQIKVREESSDGAVYILEQTNKGNRLNPSSGTRGINRNRGLIAAQDASAASLARTLSTTLLRPVVDETGLDGSYSFSLQWAEAGAPGEPEDSGVSLFTAIQEQLGLHLRSDKGQVRSIVIERADRPSEN